MSAFLLTNEHITAILQAAAPRYPGDGAAYYWGGEMRYFGGSRKKIGQKLIDENYRSVNYRYDTNETPPEFQPAMVRSMTPTEIIKLCHCYEYQTCEPPDWAETEAHAIVAYLKQRSICNLPGYDAAPWAIED